MLFTYEFCVEKSTGKEILNQITFTVSKVSVGRVFCTSTWWEFGSRCHHANNFIITGWNYLFLRTVAHQILLKKYQYKKNSKSNVNEIL